MLNSQHIIRNGRTFRTIEESVVMNTRPDWSSEAACGHFFQAGLWVFLLSLAQPLFSHWVSSKPTSTGWVGKSWERKYPPHTGLFWINAGRWGGSYGLSAKSHVSDHISHYFFLLAQFLSAAAEDKVKFPTFVWAKILLSVIVICLLNIGSVNFKVWYYSISNILKIYK